MANHRPERVADQIHREVSARLLRDIKDPRLPTMSITHVTVTRDLRRAVVTWLPLGGGEPSDEVFEALNDVAKRLRGPVGRALGVRFAPEIVFQFDRNLDAAVRVTSLLEQIEYERKTKDAPPVDTEDADTDDAPEAP